MGVRPLTSYRPGMEICPYGFPPSHQRTLGGVRGPWRQRARPVDSRVQDVGDVAGGHRIGEKIALAHVTAQVTQSLELISRLDALTGDGEVEVLGF